MTNHPNRSRRGRPAKDGAVKMSFRLAPDVAEEIRAAANQTEFVERAVRKLAQS